MQVKKCGTSAKMQLNASVTLDDYIHKDANNRTCGFQLKGNITKVKNRCLNKVPSISKNMCYFNSW